MYIFDVFWLADYQRTNKKVKNTQDINFGTGGVVLAPLQCLSQTPQVIHAKMFTIRRSAWFR